VDADQVRHAHQAMPLACARRVLPRRGDLPKCVVPRMCRPNAYGLPASVWSTRHCAGRAPTGHACATHRSHCRRLRLRNIASRRESRPGDPSRTRILGRGLRNRAGLPCEPGRGF
jgi:hypothetical protein